MVSIRGSSTKQAEVKAWALHNSLPEELNRLRADEVSHRDKSIQLVLDDYRIKLNEARANISEYQSRWGEGHPKVVAEQQRYQAARSGLLIRSNIIAGPHAASVFSSLDLEMNPKRTQKFADLIEASAKNEGISAQITDLHRSELHLKDQLKIYAREPAVLERLQREFDLAEDIFTSAAARL